MKRRYTYLCAAAICLPTLASANSAAEQTDSVVLQNSSVALEPAKEKEPNWFRKIRLTGSVQTEFLIPVTDAGMGIPHTDRNVYAADVLNNTYFDLTLNAPYLSLGGRFESATLPLPGFENDFEGLGVLYFLASGLYKW